MEYPYLELTQDDIYWVVRSLEYREGFFHLKCDLEESEFTSDFPKVEDWRKRLYRRELDWGGEKQMLAFDALCGKLLAEDRVVVAIPQSIVLPIDCFECRGSGDLIDKYSFKSSNCPSCGGTGIKDYARKNPGSDK